MRRFPFHLVQLSFRHSTSSSSLFSSLPFLGSPFSFSSLSSSSFPLSSSFSRSNNPFFRSFSGGMASEESHYLKDGIIASLDQGTQSTRFFLFDKKGKQICSSSVPLPNSYPQPGWVEQNPETIWQTVEEAVDKCLEVAKEDHNISLSHIRALGITNQRETTIVWSKSTGKVLHPAIVWSDIRSEEVIPSLLSKYGSKDHFRDRCGLPIASYFSALKLKWLLSNVEEVKKAVEEDDCLFGTVDTWILWKLTNGKVHMTDTTNASRTMLMNLETLDWDPSLISELEIPSSILPTIGDSCDFFATIGDDVLKGQLNGVPVTGLIGDQQGALLGQGCISRGGIKNTFGTGSFCLLATGEKPIHSSSGLLSTVGFSKKKGEKDEKRFCLYALEGSVSTSGAALTWAVDTMKMVPSAKELSEIASTVEDSAGMYFVPAFTGLFCPYWRTDARGIAVGLTQFVSRAHFLRSLIEASGFQTHDMIQGMIKDSGIHFSSLKADGGLSQSDVLLQFQADLLNTPVSRPVEKEATGLGAAIAAGLATNYYSLEDVPSLNPPLKVFQPNMKEETREERLKGWKKAVEKSFGWIEE